MTQGSAPRFFRSRSLGGLGHCPLPWGHVPWLYWWCLALLGAQVGGGAAWGVLTHGVPPLLPNLGSLRGVGPSWGSWRGLPNCPTGEAWPAPGWREVDV